MTTTAIFKRGKAKDLSNIEAKVKWNPRTPDKIQRHWDSRQAGLCVRVYRSPGDKSTTGLRVFYVRYSVPLTKEESKAWKERQASLPENKRAKAEKKDKQVFKKLGVWPALSVDDARAQAAEIRQNVKKGLPAESTKYLTIGQLFDKIKSSNLYPLYESSDNHKRNITYMFDKYVTFKDVPVNDVTEDHWLGIIDEEISKKKYGNAEILKKLVGTFYKNAQFDPAYRKLKNPVYGIRIHIPKSDPKQPLNSEQLKAFKDDLENPIHTAITKVLILSGQRITEVLRMRWDNINDGIWTVGEKGEMKNKKSAHHLPLTAGILEAIEPMKEYGSEWVFPGRTKHMHRTGYAPKLKLINPDVSPHSFRHTFATLGVDEAGIDSYDIQLILHHSFAGITHGTYIKAQQIERKREALEAWETYVDGL